MMQILILLISNFLNIVIFWYFCNWCIKKKRCTRWVFIALTFLLALRIFGANLEQPIINLLNAIVSYTLILITRKTQWRIKVVLLFVFISASVISEELSLLWLEVIVGAHSEFTMIDILLATGMNKLILTTFTYAGSRFFVTYTQEDIPKKNTITFLLFPITTIVIILVMRYPVMVGRINVGYFFAFTFMLFATIVSCYGFYRIAINVKVSKENTLLKERQVRDNDYYKLLLEKYEKEHYITHDIKKNVRYLQMLISHNDYEGVSKFIENYTEVVSNHEFILTGNKTFDIVLSSWCEKIKSLNIKVELKDMHNINLDKINEVDQCTIFGNIIENAIESCIKCEFDRRYIIFSFIEKESHKIFKVVNSCEEVSMSDDAFTSTKTDMENHGFGLKNIQICIQRNNGIFHSEFDARQKIYISIAIFQESI